MRRARLAAACAEMKWPSEQAVADPDQEPRAAFLRPGLSAAAVAGCPGKKGDHDEAQG